MKQLYYSFIFLIVLCLSYSVTFSQLPKLKVLWTKRTIATTLAFSPDGKQLVSGGTKLSCPYECGQIRLWDANSGAMLTDITDNELLGITRDVVVSPDGKKILSASGNTICDEGCYADKAGLFTYGLSGVLEQYFPTYSNNAYAIAISPDGQTIASSYRGGGLFNTYLYDTAYNLLQTLASGVDEIFDIAFTPDGKKIMTSSAAGTISVYDFATGALLVTMEHGGYDVGGNQMYIDVSSDGKYVVSSGNGYNNVVKVWRIADGALLYTLDTHLTFGLNYARARFTPDGKYIVAGLYTYGGTGELLAWNFADGSEIADFNPPMESIAYGGISDIAFSSIHDGRYNFSFTTANGKYSNIVTGVIIPSASSDKTTPLVKAIPPATSLKAVTVLNNPFHDQLTLRFNQGIKGKVNIRLSDMAGRVVLEQNYTIVSPQTLLLHAGDKALDHGMYVLTVTAEGSVYKTKLLQE